MRQTIARTERPRAARQLLRRWGGVLVLLAPSILLAEGEPANSREQHLNFADMELAAPTMANEAVEDTDALRAARRYQEAIELMHAADYSGALEVLRSIVREFPFFEDISAVRTRINVLHEADRAGGALLPYLSALDARDAGRAEIGIEILSRLPDDFPNNPLLDDALYLRAYLQIMERYDFAAGLAALAELDLAHPDSAYAEASDYLEAIALEQVGDTAEAIALFEAIRDRHTAFALPFGQRYPRGDVMSRYWFTRAQQRLDVIESANARRRAHSDLERRPDGQLRMDVEIEGQRFGLLLRSSPLLASTRWLDETLASTAPANAEVFAGEVIGYENSWARVVIGRHGVVGMIEADGLRYRLEHDHFIGTIDWYQPKHRAGGVNPSPEMPGFGELMLDAMDAPPSLRMRSRDLRVSTEGYSTTRALPISIVVDSQYDRYFAGEGLLYVLDYLNIADQMYRDYGFALVLDEVVMVEAEENDPFALGAVSLETMLRNFRDYRLRNTTLFEESGLVYLFSGNPRTDITLGLAWVDTACRLDGYDVGVTTPSTFGGLLLAHEVGHSLGALHDTDTACADEHDWLMWPQVSNSTRLSFSRCSAESVSTSRAGDCLLDTIDLGIRLEGDHNSIDLIISNHDQMMYTDARVEIEIGAGENWNWPAACELSGPLTGTCYLNDLLQGGAMRLALVPEDGTLPETPVLIARVSPIGLIDASPMNNMVTLGMVDDEPLAPISQLPEHHAAYSGGSAGDGGGKLHPLWLLLAPLLAWRRASARVQS